MHEIVCHDSSTVTQVQNSMTWCNSNDIANEKTLSMLQITWQFKQIVWQLEKVEQQGPNMNLKLRGYAPSLLMYIPIPSHPIMDIWQRYACPTIGTFHICVASRVDQSVMPPPHCRKEDNMWRITITHFDWRPTSIYDYSTVLPHSSRYTDLG